MAILVPPHPGKNEENGKAEKEEEVGNEGKGKMMSRRRQEKKREEGEKVVCRVDLLGLSLKKLTVASLFHPREITKS